MGWHEAACWLTRLGAPGPLRALLAPREAQDITDWLQEQRFRMKAMHEEEVKREAAKASKPNPISEPPPARRHSSPAICRRAQLIVQTLAALRQRAGLSESEP